MANKAFIYRIYPDKNQEQQLQKTFGCCRFVYNSILALQEERYKAGEKHLSKTEANSYCNRELKEEYPFLREVDKFALTNSIFHLDEGYRRFFLRLGKHPKYKSKHKARRSYTTNITNHNIEIGERYIKLPKLGKVKAVIHRFPQDGWKIKSATITQNRDDTYQVSVLFSYEEQRGTVPVSSINTLGLDYKSDGLYTDSNGHFCDMPPYYRESSPRLAKAQRKLRHKKVGSRNYEKQQRRVARIHRHIANQRKDYLHQESTAIAKRYDCVCVEDLNMRTMANRGFGNGKSTLDNGYGMFLNMLEYKLQDRGKCFIKVSKFFPSSQVCHHCGMIHPEMKDLRIRIMECSCGCKADRDVNAALNIKTEGLRLLAAQVANNNGR